MALYTYDAEADILYVLLSDEDEPAVQRTDELGPNLHVDLDTDGRVVGVEFLYPRTHGMNTSLVRERYGIELQIPFSFAA